MEPLSAMILESHSRSIIPSIIINMIGQLRIIYHEEIFKIEGEATKAIKAEEDSIKAEEESIKVEEATTQVSEEACVDFKELFVAPEEVLSDKIFYAAIVILDHTKFKTAVIGSMMEHHCPQ